MTFYVKPTEDEIRYYNRTIQHIHRVQKNMFVLITKYHGELDLNFGDRRHLAHTVMKHDQSKFSTDQHSPYIELTKYYHQRKALGNKDYEYPNQETKDAVENAITHHYYSENHHPERCGGYVSRMNKFDVIEVCCDLQAMAQEFGEDSGRKYYEEVWCAKHKDVEGWRAYMEMAFSCFEKENNND